MSQDRRTETDLPPGPGKDLVDLFKKLQARSGLTVNRLAVKTAMSSGHVSEVLRGRKAPSPRTSVIIVKALGAEAGDVDRAWPGQPMAG